MKCLICGSDKNVEMHHLTPKIWQKEKNDETIPLCKFHHGFMPPFARYTVTYKGAHTTIVMHDIIRVLNKKVRYWRWSIRCIQTFKTGNRVWGIDQKLREQGISEIQEKVKA